jgi:hypothetical protein
MPPITAQGLSQTINDAIAAAGSSAPPWSAATDALIDHLIDAGCCFSSGEIAAILRTYRPDLRFSVTQNIGEHVRDRFYAATFPLYADSSGAPMPTVKVSRLTRGYTRTPAGTTVFVYGPSLPACNAHPFEVEIPRPGGQIPNPNALPSRPAQPITPKQKLRMMARPQRARTRLVAQVQSDGSLMVPRDALEEYLHLSGQALPSGAPVYSHRDGDHAVVTLTTQPGSTACDLRRGRGAVIFRIPWAPIKPGERFHIQATSAKMVIMLDRPL